MAVLPIVMAAFSALGALSEANTASNNATAQRYAAENNALADKQQAATVMQQTNMEEEALRKKGRQAAGEQRAAIAEAGTGTLSTTNQDLAVQSAKAAEQDALNLRYSGLLQRHGLLAQSDQELYQAKVLKGQAKSIKASGYLSAVGKGLSAYSSYGGSFGKTTGEYT